jgi:hypothetical protein
LIFDQNKNMFDLSGIKSKVDPIEREKVKEEFRNHLIKNM